MGIAERIYEIVKVLPEEVASEVLEFAERMRAIGTEEELAKERAEGLALMDKHAGKFEMVKYNRDDLHDRPGPR